MSPRKVLSGAGDARAGSRKKRCSAKDGAKGRPCRKMVRTSEEVQRWSALLAEEMVSWPRVNAKPMFGFRAFYRGEALFTILPQTRSFDSGNLLILKFDPMPENLLQRAMNDSRIDTTTRVPRKGWFMLALASGDHLRDALWWIQQAFACAGNISSRERAVRERVKRRGNSQQRKSRGKR